MSVIARAVVNVIVAEANAKHGAARNAGKEGIKARTAKK
jgi:hypothetical protein